MAAGRVLAPRHMTMHELQDKWFQAKIFCVIAGVANLSADFGKGKAEKKKGHPPGDALFYFAIALFKSSMNSHRHFAFSRRF